MIFIQQIRIRLLSRLMAMGGVVLPLLGNVQGADGFPPQELPDGWVELRNQQDCHTGEVGVQRGYRNAQGTIWVISHVVPPEAVVKFLDNLSPYHERENGTVSGLNYSVVTRVDKPDSPYIFIPQYRCFISLMLTQNGRTVPEEAVRWWSPPKDEEFQAYLSEAKAFIFSTLVPIIAAEADAE